MAAVLQKICGGEGGSEREKIGLTNIRGDKTTIA